MGDLFVAATLGERLCCEKHCRVSLQKWSGRCGAESEPRELKGVEPDGTVLASLCLICSNTRRVRRDIIVRRD